MATQSLWHNAVTEIKLRRIAKKEHSAFSRILKPKGTFLTYLLDVGVGMLLGAVIIWGLLP